LFELVVGVKPHGTKKSNDVVDQSFDALHQRPAQTPPLLRFHHRYSTVNLACPRSATHQLIKHDGMSQQEDPIHRAEKRFLINSYSSRSPDPLFILLPIAGYGGVRESPFFLVLPDPLIFVIVRDCEVCRAMEFVRPSARSGI
jgi:hypothetical protein